MRNILKIPPIRIKLLFIIILILISGCDALSKEKTPEILPEPTATQMEITTPSITPTPTAIVIQGTVTIWHSWNEYEMPAFLRIINDFSALYPNVYFDVLYVPIESIRERFEAAVRDGTGPTLLIGPAEWGPLLYEGGYIADLKDLFNPIVLEKLNQPAIDSSKYKNALVGLPYTVEGIVLFRNKQIIPDSAATFEQLIYNANQTSQAGVLGAMLERSFIYAGAHLEGIGGKLMDSQGYPAFNDPKGIEWLELLQSFDKTGPADYFTNQDVDLFKKGGVGLIIDGTWNLKDIASAIGAENLSIDRWPDTGEGQLSGYVFPENLYLNAHIDGERRNATLKFMEFLISEQAQSKIAEIGIIPAATNLVMTDPITGTLMTKAISALSEGSGYPVIPELELYAVPMDLALRSVFFNAVSPEEALKTAHDSILQALASPLMTPTATP